ncbi:hypothetical protein [Legionella beliardensis]|nr:hypothetical protein [Legionella beliardensis]
MKGKSQKSVDNVNNKRQKINHESTLKKSLNKERKLSNHSGLQNNFFEWKIMSEGFEDETFYNDELSYEDKEDKDESKDEEEDNETIVCLKSGNILKKKFECNIANDLQSGEIFYISTSAQLFSFDEKTAIELAVCGGNIYAMLLGEEQPYYLVGQGEKSFYYYRLSSKVNIFEQAEGESIFRFNKPVSRFISSLVISYFLGDNDISNVVLVKKDDQFLVVRIDPEFCFSSYFFNTEYNNQSSILAELNFLLKLNDKNCSNKKQLQYFLSHQKEIDFFQSCFNDHKLLSTDNCLKLLSSPLKKQELLLALNKIVATPFQDFEKIIDNTLSDNTVSKKLKKTLAKRLDFFKKANEQIQKQQIFSESKSGSNQQFFQPIQEAPLKKAESFDQRFSRK